MNPLDNIPAIIQRKVSEGEIRQAEREQIAKWIESLKQQQLPEVFRKCGFGDEDNDEGWIDLKPTELSILSAIAKKLRG